MKRSHKQVHHASKFVNVAYRIPSIDHVQDVIPSHHQLCAQFIKVAAPSREDSRTITFS